MRNFGRLVARTFALMGIVVGGVQAQTKNIEKMLRVESSREQSRGTNDLGTDNFRIVIQRSALRQEFLLQGNVVYQDSAPAFGGLRSKIVSFKQRANKWVMEKSF